MSATPPERVESTAEPPLDLIVRRIVEGLDPERIILFGSRARGDPRPDSDVDLMVVMKTEQPFFERMLRVRVARQHGLRAVAFPAISTGIYGYPLDRATAIAVATVREFLEDPGPVEEVVFACFDEKVLRAYREAGVEG